MSNDCDHFFLFKLFLAIMSFILQSNFERKNFNSEIRNEAASMSIKDDKLVENLRNLVKEYLEIVSFFIPLSLTHS